jgi:hypothetical protein
MIHVGGAGGGHYFAYIKSFADEMWYKFDDANVSPLPENDLNRIFNEVAEEEKSKGKVAPPAAPPAAPPSIPTAPPSAPPIAPSGAPPVAPPTAPIVAPPTVSSTPALPKSPPLKPKATELLNVPANAYMLLYRKRSPVNMRTVDLSQVPNELKQEIEAEDDAFKLQKAELERQKNLTRIRVKHAEQVFTVEVKKDETFAQALIIVYDQLKLADSGIGLDRIRLRELDTLKNVSGRPFDTFSSDLVGSFNFPDNKNMILEVRPENEAFPEYDLNDLVFRVVELDQESKEFKDPVQVGVPQNASVKQLRAAIANKWNVTPMNVRMVFISDDSAMNLIKDEELLVGDLKLQKGFEIQAERCLNFTEGDSLILQKFHDSINIVP